MVIFLLLLWMSQGRFTFLKNMSTFFQPFLKKLFILFFIFLLQKIQKFPDSAQSRQILWVVKPKKFAAHQSLREPQTRFWAVRPTIWLPCFNDLTKLESSKVEVVLQEGLRSSTVQTLR